MGDPDAIRTHDPQLRRLLLYPLSYGTIQKRKFQPVNRRKSPFQAAKIIFL
jgi:hypothetical protein